MLRLRRALRQCCLRDHTAVATLSGLVIGPARHASDALASTAPRLHTGGNLANRTTHIPLTGLGTFAGKRWTIHDASYPPSPVDSDIYPSSCSARIALTASCKGKVRSRRRQQSKGPALRKMQASSCTLRLPTVPQKRAHVRECGAAGLDVRQYLSRRTPLMRHDCHFTLPAYRSLRSVRLFSNRDRGRTGPVPASRRTSRTTRCSTVRAARI